MNEEIKNDEVNNEVEEVNPVDEYLKNHKEQKLAEFCVNKDKEIADSKKELQNLLYKSKYNNSNSKYNSNLFIGKNILGINILGFLSSDRELGILYPVFICQCFCGRLFLRECRHIENSKKISCGHCNDHIKKKIAFGD